jgi:hypothetical protein
MNNLQKTYLRQQFMVNAVDDILFADNDNRPPIYNKLRDVVGIWAGTVRKAWDIGYFARMEILYTPHY